MPPQNFFRSVTKIICSTLNLQNAITNLYQYLQKNLPVDTINFDIYDDEKRVLHNIISVHEGATRLIADLTINESIHQKFMRTAADVNMLSGYIPNSNDEDITRKVSKRIGIKDFSGVICYLRIDGELLGVATFARSKVHAFSEEEIDTLSSLNDPLTIAMVNALRFDELKAVKDQLQDDNKFLQRELAKKAGETVIGARTGLKNTLNMLSQVANTDVPVMLLGETGVGKEVLANALHRMSPRHDKPFITVNCGAIPESLVDSVLFGHEKGAFTGAAQQRKGRFERANGGTLLLDEIGELPPDAQVRLLRVLQEKTIERVGGDTEIPIDARIIAATHRDLKKLVDEGKFREDLWFRLSTFPVVVPPLRERKVDIPLLLAHFLTTCSAKLGVPQPAVTPEGIENLTSYHWPGNVREMHNVVERQIILGQGKPLTFSSLKFSGDSQDSVATTKATATPLVLNSQQAFPTLDEVTRMYIEKALQHCNGKIEGADGAAQLLGVNASTLRHRMRKLGIVFGKKR
ncbi:sigma-54-dependent Fis family transcriptional regulator [Halodesulfovibrio marinisediminis]|uniref:Transcriptional regulator containing GAF, AAA-type ATPase, and DNA-binding Fis domains n=1 Tax=Halodesulfovibrio marinisediminis DSM 17456 TaxID=1121457 RepID=A0A1N6IIF6_9BACT|nr:sigma 54-interacting transcriptional regulator [Halodesulfovibrio marinisediminis]SIO31830.1 Transcriptional regulator containing GAF, AAA-type ATPase, and DNA-binding Fis domains [Halodesulfovibrio marinisediminis DSM 17456]